MQSRCLTWTLIPLSVSLVWILIRASFTNPEKDCMHIKNLTFIFCLGWSRTQELSLRRKHLRLWWLVTYLSYCSRRPQSKSYWSASRKTWKDRTVQIWTLQGPWYCQRGHERNLRAWHKSQIAPHRNPDENQACGRRMAARHWTCHCSFQITPEEHSRILQERYQQALWNVVRKWWQINVNNQYFDDEHFSLSHISDGCFRRWQSIGALMHFWTNFYFGVNFTKWLIGLACRLLFWAILQFYDFNQSMISLDITHSHTQCMNSIKCPMSRWHGLIYLWDALEQGIILRGTNFDLS